MPNNHEAIYTGDELTKNKISGGAKGIWWGIKKGFMEAGLAFGQFVPDTVKKAYEGSLLQKGVAALKLGVGTAAAAVSNGVRYAGGKLLEGIQKAFPADGAFRRFFRAIGNGIGKAAAAVGRGLAFAGQKIAAGIVYTGQKIAGLAGKIKAAYKGSRLQRGLQAVGKALAPTGRVLKKIGTGIATGVGAVAYGIGKVFSAIGRGIGLAVSKLQDTFGGVSFETADIKSEIYERNRQALDKTYNDRVENFRTKQAMHNMKESDLGPDENKARDVLKDAQDGMEVTYYESDGKETTLDAFDNISYLADTNRLKEQLNNQEGFGEGSYEMRALNEEGKDIDRDVKHEGFTQKIDETNSKAIIQEQNEKNGVPNAEPVEIQYKSVSNKLSDLEIELFGAEDNMFSAGVNIVKDKIAINDLKKFRKEAGKEIREQAKDRHYGKLLFEAATSRKQVFETEKMGNVNLVVMAALCSTVKTTTGINVDKMGLYTAVMVNEVAGYIKKITHDDKTLVIDNVFGSERGFKAAQEKFNMTGDELLHEVVRSSNCAELSQVADRIRLEQSLQIASNYNKGYAHGSEKFVQAARLVDEKGQFDVERVYKLLGGGLRIKDVLATRQAEQGRTRKSFEKEQLKNQRIQTAAKEELVKKVESAPVMRL